jgi:hypothetical protein
MVYRKLHSTYSMLNGLCYGTSLHPDRRRQLPLTVYVARYVRLVSVSVNTTDYKPNISCDSIHSTRPGHREVVLPGTANLRNSCFVIQMC